MVIEAAKVSEIVCGGMKAVDVEGTKIVIGNVNNVFYAVSRQCSHLGASLDMGTLDDYILTCPLHYAQFDIRTGEALTGPVPPDPRCSISDLATYPVKVEKGSVYISL